MFEVGLDEFEKRLVAYRHAGSVLGSHLAKALLLAVGGSRSDRLVQVKLSAILLREILAAVQRLRDLGVPDALVHAYERACRQACREELGRRLEPSSPSRKAA